MTVRQNIETMAPLQLLESQARFVVLRLIDPKHQNFFPYLSAKVRKYPETYHHAPLVLDLSGLDPESDVLDFRTMMHGLKAHHLLPIGFLGGSEAQQKAANSAGLVKIEPSDTADTPKTKDNVVSLVSNAEPSKYTPTMIISKPVRSGRQIYAQNSDLIVLAPVSAGAEIVADGSIHVYATLRGRALAGVKGDQQARIFCHNFEAELVSIAGIYQISENMGKENNKKNVQIYLDQGSLHIQPF